MPTDLPLALEGVSAGTLRQLAGAVRSGQLPCPVTAFSLSRVGLCPAALAADLQRLTAEGLRAPHLANLLDLGAAVVEARMLSESAVDLVWTGPENVHARSRDTLIVLDELFASAQQSIFVSTFVVHQPERVFATLAARLDAVPTLRACLFVHIDRKHGDTTLEFSLLHQYASKLASGWPGVRRPEVYYDPRGLSPDAENKATWHAKCVIVDDAVALVTSANFTEWAQRRNVEAGALVRSRHFALQLRSQFDSLVASQLVQRLPHF